MAVFVDIEGAFNNAIRSPLYKAVKSRGVELTIAGWIAAMLTDSLVIATRSGEMVRFKPGRGCPQRGILSPPLRPLLVDDLLAIVEALGAEVQMYADDIVILSGEKEISSGLQEA